MITVPFSEMPGSPTEEWYYGGFRATVKLICAWEHRNTLALEVLGNGGEYYPRLPMTMARARGVSIAPFDARITHDPLSGLVAPYASFASCEAAVLTIQYDSTGPDGDELITEALEPTAEFQSLGAEGFEWQSVVDELGFEWRGRELRAEEAPGLLVRGLDYKVTLHKVLFIPTAVIDLVGCVNDSPIAARFLGLTFPPETLLYNPPTTQRRITVETVEAWTLNYRFTFRPSGWNKFWRAETGKWERIYQAYKDENDQPQSKPYNSYKLGDLSQLLEVT
jgi:hypothetical protein